MDSCIIATNFALFTAHKMITETLKGTFLLLSFLKVFLY